MLRYSQIESYIEMKSIDETVTKKARMLKEAEMRSNAKIQAIKASAEASSNEDIEETRDSLNTRDFNPIVDVSCVRLMKCCWQLLQSFLKFNFSRRDVIII